MRHTLTLLGAGLAALAVGTAPRPAHAQSNVNTNNTVYDSLTYLTTQPNSTVQTGTTDVTGNFTGDHAITQRNAGAMSGDHAYSARFGPDLASNGAANVNGTLSTSLVADDLYLRTAATAAGGNATVFNLNTFRTLLTNENANALSVTLNVRFYADDGQYTNPSGVTKGGFAGTLLYSAQQNVNLAGGTAARPDVTQVEFNFSSSPLTFSNFNTTMAANYYEKRIWVGLFVTADAGTTLLSDFNNVGSIVYDRDIANRQLSTFRSDAGEARSTDLFFGDDTPNISGNSPYNRSLYTNSTTKNIDLPGAEQFLVGGLNGLGTSPSSIGPDANLAFFLNGTTFDVPEPGSLGFIFAGAAPLGLLLLRRARRKSA